MGSRDGGRLWGLPSALGRERRTLIDYNSQHQSSSGKLSSGKMAMTVRVREKRPLGKENRGSSPPTSMSIALLLLDLEKKVLCGERVPIPTQCLGFGRCDNVNGMGMTYLSEGRS